MLLDSTRPFAFSPGYYGAAKDAIARREQVRILPSEGGKDGLCRGQREMGLACEGVDMARLFQLVGWLREGMKLAQDPRRRLAKSDASHVSIEQSHDVWVVVWQKPGTRTRFLANQIALYEAQQADQRGELELADRLRYAATEAQSRNKQRH